jgi:peptidoglycan/LPS O-acetylase OafA/YrhL
VVGVALASFGIRILLWLIAGLNDDPWSYRFFPSELMFFMLGAAAYHAYAENRDGCASSGGKFADLMRPGSLPARGALAAMAVVSVWVGRIGQPFGAGHVIAPLTTAAAYLALPALFAKTRRSPADQALGELSYPIYICHVLVIWIVGRGDYSRDGLQFVIVAVLTLLSACVLYRCVDLPIDRWRHRITSAKAVPVARRHPLPAPRPAKAAE